MVEASGPLAFDQDDKPIFGLEESKYLRIVYNRFKMVI